MLPIATPVSSGPPPTASLSSVLLWRVVGMSVLLTLLATLLAAHFNQEQELVRQRNQLNAVIAAHQSALAKSVWELDEAAVRLQLDALKHFPAVLIAEVQGDGLHERYQKAHSSAADAGEVISVPLVTSDGDKPVATWTLTCDARALSQEVWLQTVRFIGLVLPLLGVMALMVFVLVYRRVSQPVRSLTQHVNALSADRLHTPLPHPPVALAREMRQLAEGISRLQEALAAQLDDREAVAATLAAQKAQLNKLLATQTQQLDELLSFTADGAGVLDAAGTIVAANPAWTDMMGWVRHLWPGRAPVADWLAEPAWPELLLRLTQASRLVACELTLKHTAGRTMPMEVSLSVMERDHEDRPIRIHIVLRDLSQRREVERTLIEAREQALSATRTKSAFLANMSHEIRTPLNAVIGLTELALHTALSTTQRDLLSKSRQAAQTLLGIIHDILDFSKIEAGKLELDLRPFDLDELLDDLIALVALPARDKGLGFVVDVGPQVPRRVVGDALRLKQVLTNLCFNAIKFTPHGRVSLSLRATPQGEGFTQWTWTVHDTGPGMDLSAQARLFLPFSQVDETHQRRHGGTGLGLAISQELVHAMGGRIQLDSDVGQGCQFTATMTLPVDEQAMPPLPWSRAPVVGLVIEPQERVATPLALCLQEAGVQVTVAADLAQARVWAHGQAALAAPEVMGLWLGPSWEGARAHELLDALMPILSGRSVKVCRLLPWGAAWVPREHDVTHHQDTGEAWLHWPGTASGLRRAWLQAALGASPAARPQPPAAVVSTMSLEAPPIALQGLKVLLVEDNPLNQEVAAGMLALAGVHTEVAGDGQQALDHLSAAHVDAVLMDVQMPVMDGLTATRRIRSRPEWARLPIVGMSANAMSRDREQALLAGMNAYLTKPIDHMALWTTLARLCGEARPAAVHAGEPEQAPVLDRDVGLAVCANDPVLYARLSAMFIQSHADAQARQRAWLEAAQWPALSKHLHQLKADAATVGASWLSAASRDAEACALLDVPSRHQAMRQQLKALWPVLEATLEALRLAEQPAAAPADSPADSPAAV